MDLIERLRWEVGIVSDEHKEKLSAYELNYYDEYNTLLADYMQSTNIDLTGVCIFFFSKKNRTIRMNE